MKLYDGNNMSNPNIMIESQPPSISEQECRYQQLKEFIERKDLQYVTVDELALPHNKKVADDLGWKFLIPPDQYFVHLLVIHKMLFEPVRHLVGSPIYIRNWYRPDDYNSRVGGSDGSQHRFARAYDMDFVSDVDCDEAYEFILEFRENNKDLKIGIGKGSKTIHIDYGWKERDWKY